MSWKLSFTWLKVLMLFLPVNLWIQFAENLIEPFALSPESLLQAQHCYPGQEISLDGFIVTEYAIVSCNNSIIDNTIYVKWGIEQEISQDTIINAKIRTYVRC